jgi:ATP-dependent RNA helicase DDX51/DBP6
MTLLEGANVRIITTDLLSRGMDIKGVKHVVNYDCPPTPRVYVHRAGRTARASEYGDVWTLLEHSEGRLFWKGIVKGMVRNNEMNRIKIPSGQEEKNESL